MGPTARSVYRFAVAIDLEPEMVAAARPNAPDLGIGRIHWLVGR